MLYIVGLGYWIIKGGWMRGLWRRWIRGFRKVGRWRGLSQAFRERVYYIGVVQYSAHILCRRRGDAEIDVDVI